MGKTKPYRLAAAIAALGIVASLFVAATPAQAYWPNPSTLEATVNTSPGGDCRHTGGILNFDKKEDHCYNWDQIDSTFLKYDQGGLGVKILLNHNGLLGKVEFHPYGEHFWVYDTKDDGDGFYYMLTAHHSVGDTHYGPYSAGGGAGVDVRDINLSIAEGVPVTVRVYDNSGRRDLVAIRGGRA